MKVTCKSLCLLGILLSGCSGFQKTISPVLNGFWKNSDGSQVWIFDSDSNFYFGKFKSENIHIFMCGTYLLKSQGDSLVVLIHDRIGNDLKYDFFQKSDSLYIGSGEDRIALIRFPEGAFDPNCPDDK